LSQRLFVLPKEVVIGSKKRWNSSTNAISVAIEMPQDAAPPPEPTHTSSAILCAGVDPVLQ